MNVRLGLVRLADGAGAFGGLVKEAPIVQLPPPRSAEPMARPRAAQVVSVGVWHTRRAWDDGGYNEDQSADASKLWRRCQRGGRCPVLDSS